MQQTRYKFVISIFTLLLLLAGCVPSISVRDSAQSALEEDPQYQQALLFEQTQDYQRAADLFLQLAERYPEPSKTQLLLRAVENYFNAQNIEQAANLLSTVDATAFPQLAFRKQLLLAELALSKNRPDSALSMLATPPAESVPLELRQKYRQLRAEGFRLSGNLLESARELMELDFLLSDEATQLENQKLILQTLSMLTDTALELLQPSPPGILGGWMELARVKKQPGGSSAEIQALLLQWRERFPNHPALPTLIDDYTNTLKSQFHRPEHIAVMLPESGPYAGAAKALREGFMAAYYEEPSNRRPRLVFYDSSNSSDVWPLYQQAIDAGAEMVIGPLSKEGVAHFARAGDLPIPVLALNQVPPEVQPPVNLIQFSLSPEDEAAQVAERAWLDGHELAVVMTPQGQWGERMLNAFRQRWERLGGTLAEHRTYDSKQNDFGEPIQALLNLDQSQARKNSVQRMLGKKVEFEPRRRQDATFLFLAARPQKARQIRPQLQFHHAFDLPVYATSHLYSGDSDPKQDQDLEGIRFPDIPWLLASDSSQLSQQNLSKSLGQTQLAYPRLYAMGIDGFKLLPHLARLQSSTRETYDAQTGTLYLDGIRHIHRQLVWAEIEKGKPKVLGFAPRMDSGLNEMAETAPTTLMTPAVDTQAAPVKDASSNAEIDTKPALIRNAE